MAYCLEVIVRLYNNHEILTFEGKRYFRILINKFVMYYYYYTSMVIIYSPWKVGTRNNVVAHADRRLTVS